MPYPANGNERKTAAYGRRLGEGEIFSFTTSSSPHLAVTLWVLP